MKELPTGHDIKLQLLSQKRASSKENNIGCNIVSLIRLPLQAMPKLIPTYLIISLGLFWQKICFFLANGNRQYSQQWHTIAKKTSLTCLFLHVFKNATHTASNIISHLFTGCKILSPSVSESTILFYVN